MSQACKVIGLCLLSALVLQLASAEYEKYEVDDSSVEYMIAGVKIYPNDRQCTLVGGLCVHTSDCILPTTNKGLCPTSTALGVECCYELGNNLNS